MATIPPPLTPREARRQARYAARAQMYQARLNCRRSSIVRPVVLITVGVVALLLETGKLNPMYFWGWYSHWWPILLIAIGLLLLGEWFLDRDQPYTRCGTGGGVVFLVLLLAFIGWGTHAAHIWGPLHDQFSDNSDDFFSMLGEEHDNDIEFTQAVASNAAIQIENPRGDIVVTSAADDQVHVRAHEVVHSSSDRNTQRDFDALRPRLIATGSSAVLTVAGRNNGRVDLVLEVPRNSSLNINAAHGDVSITGLNASADVNAGRGDVKFDTINGDVHARMNHGDFSAHSITGHAFLDGHAGDVTISDVKGSVVINGEFFGDTHVEQAGSTVHFHSSRTDLDVPRLNGDLTMDSGDLHISQPAGPVRVVTRSKDIEITQLTGDAHIQNSNGEVNLTAMLPLGNIDVSNSTGGISLTLPPTANFEINARTSKDESVQTDFQLTAASSDDTQILSGKVGQGGPKITLTTNHGEIEIRKGDTGPGVEPPMPPMPKRPPHPKAPPEPRLKAPSGPEPHPVSQ